ncbi:hypothetical protein F941_02262 [Acinetobacter bouvetii DSM 14964 = CIP 107468]|jgi:hypothetical protein|uniref:DUF3015 domain-containing protein n=3 Tax=Acinetobacter TaxID=469 RepID=N9C9M4_9GAMM|nr:MULTISPECIES: DUF3015 family protein [Acinetobacter]QXW25180.1 DUF3015 domain-containing protein [Acinetobacter johnsonii]ENV82221.1 hypothetical protein F941_02262 [Acinetobacter bouvetii DSM 14964 = CIP 107468]MCW8038783.1 DUF3015 domain-containing protein [Acinetobacter entericus]RZG67765.1 DUF3015 domain-containing protein [Acinetobacter bouvetii]TCB73226.1 DUF3015 domain-containing protein [Acinetobacter sp. ANC 4177]
MFKKLALAAVLAAGSTAAFADRDAGCGIGSQVWAGQSGKVPKILAATTNGLFANQLFGITFGTLGCSGTGTVTAQAVTFTNENSESLARDMAVGQGESLNVLAELLNIKAADKAHFFAVSKANFSKIYAAENASSVQVLASLQSVMAQDNVLKAYV